MATAVGRGVVRAYGAQTLRTAGLGPASMAQIMRLAYFTQAYTHTPHAIDMVTHLGLQFAREGRLGRACDMFSEVMTAPALGVCAADDPVLARALHRSVQALCAAPAPQWEAHLDRATHPALALAVLYDQCTSAGLHLPSVALSKVVAVLARHTPLNALRPLLDSVCASQLARPPDTYTPSVLSALVAAYGRAQRPDLGEAFLAAYVARHGGGRTSRAIATDARPAHLAFLRWYTSRPHPVDVPWHACWASHTDVWNALVRARTLAGHLVEARLWLERFRLSVTLPAAALAAAGIARPARTASPYLTLMHALSSTDGVRRLVRHVSPGVVQALESRAAPHTTSPFKTAVVHDILQAVRRDRVVPGVAMLNMLASFEAGCGRTDAAKAMAAEALALESGPTYVTQRTRRAAPAGGGTTGVRAHVSTLPSLFRLCAAVARQQTNSASWAPRAIRLWPATDVQYAPYATPRALLALCVHLGTRRSCAKTARWLKSRGTELLNEALDAMLWANDLPAAWYVLQLYGKWGMRMDAWTQLYVWRRCHALALPSVPPEPPVVQPGGATMPAFVTTLLAHAMERQLEDVTAAADGTWLAALDRGATPAERVRHAQRHVALEIARLAHQLAADVP